MLMFLLCQFHPLLGLLLFGSRDDFALAKFREIVCKLLKATTDEIDILITLLEKYLSYLGPLTLIAHVDNYELIRRVLKAEKLRDDLITPDVRRRIVQSFFDVTKHVLLWLTHI
jgi:hypothetical protein